MITAACYIIGLQQICYVEGFSGVLKGFFQDLLRGYENVRIFVSRVFENYG